MNGKRTTRTTDGVSHLVGFPLFFLNLFFSYECWLVDYLLIVNIVNKVIYRGVKLLCLLIRCCKYLGKLISIYKRMILFLNTVNLLICEYLYIYPKIRKCLQDVEILKISCNEMKNE